MNPPGVSIDLITIPVHTYSRPEAYLQGGFQIENTSYLTYYILIRYYEGGGGSGTT